AKNKGWQYAYHTRTNGHRLQDFPLPEYGGYAGAAGRTLWTDHKHHDSNYSWNGYELSNGNDGPMSFPHPGDAANYLYHDGHVSSFQRHTVPGSTKLSNEYAQRVERGS
ncbi:MAG: hypothetical protein ACOC9P_02730, partial [bacterium]